jgi:hypothetical protein
VCRIRQVQEEGWKPTTPASPGLAPQLSPNSNTNFGRASLDQWFFFRPKRGPYFEGKHPSLGEVHFEVRKMTSIYRGRRLRRVEDLCSFMGHNLPSHNTIACRGRCMRRWSRKSRENRTLGTSTEPKPVAMLMNQVFSGQNQQQRVQTGLPT